VVVSLLYVITYNGLLLVHEDVKKFSFRDVFCPWYDIVEEVCGQRCVDTCMCNYFTIVIHA
jgi:hypothetical protein